MKKDFFYRKTLVISGATSGLGRGLTKKFILGHSCKVYAIGRSQSKFDSLIAELGENADKLVPVVMDVTDKQKWQELKNELSNQGQIIDGIINCAGVLPPFKRAVDTPPAEIESVLNANFLSCVYSISALYPILSSNPKPVIANVASSAALCTIVGTGGYSASKSALKSYTEALIYELKGKAYVSLVMPGFARTDIFRSQNTGIDQNKLILAMSMPADKMVNKIYKGILKHRTRMVFGKDAHLMSFFYRLMPKTTMSLIPKILKKADVKIFEDVFKD